MNLAVESTVRQIEEHNNVSLKTGNQPVLSIIYNNGKTLDQPLHTSLSANVLPSQFNAFDIDQMTLQVIDLLLRKAVI